MSVEFIGSVVSLCCGDVLGTYQGKVVRVDESSQTVTIEKAFRNGTRCTVPNITINAADINELKILKSSDEVQVNSPKHNALIINESPLPAASSQCSRPKLAATQPGPTKDDISRTGVQHKSSLRTNSSASSAKHASSMRSSPRSEQLSHSGNHGNGGKGHRNSPSYGHKSPMRNHAHDENGHGNGNYGNTGYSNGCGPPPSPTKGPRQLMENGYGNNHQRSSPARIDDGAHGGGQRVRNNSFSDGQPVNANKRGHATPRKNEQRKKNPRDDCFSAPVDTFLNEEFDFEKNLALFNKQAVFEEIENLGYPRIVRHAERQETKYRNDENVLPSKPAVFCQIKVPGSAETQKEFVTDSGLVVPCIGHETRSKLLEVAESNGYSLERQIETVGRSASEMALQLIGGSHRLNPQNAHQRPSVVVLCGPHVQGAQAMNCARHLAAHGVRVTVFLPNFVKVLKELKAEETLYDLCVGQKTHNPKDLPTMPVDLIINALDSHENKLLQDQAWYQALVMWTNQNKAPVLAVDPPVMGGAIDIKWSLSIGLPLPLSEKCGQVYLCDLSLPNKMYLHIGIKYTSPFAHKFLVPLHRS